jgi:hypothetical protein
MLQDVNAHSLLEFGACKRPCMLVQHVVLIGSQTLIEDWRISCVPCLLHFSPVGKREKAPPLRTLREADMSCRQCEGINEKSAG